MLNEMGNPAPKATFIAQLTVDVGDPLSLGEDSRGQRRFISITGGTVKGEHLNGAVLPGGGDWQSIRSDGVAELHARYFLETDSGARIEVENMGFRHGPPEVMQRLQRGEPVAQDEYYFQTTPRFSTTSEQYSWMTKTIFVGSAERTVNRVVVNLFAIN